ncbi:MAG: DUF3857 domain-containing protein [Bdellovibrio sp.]|nr:DUF3857 domain-containing protein [Bdellovibrio sp.]
MNNILYTSLMIYLITLPLMVRAEWAKEDSAPYQIVNSFVESELLDSGGSVAIYTNEMKALNEQGRSQLVLQTIPFVPDANKIQVLDASSFTNGIEEKVDLSKIQSRTAAGDKSGVSSRQELVIPFNNLKIGSTIKYTYKLTQLRTIVPGFSEENFQIGLPMPELKGGARVKSKKPLYLNYNDPWKVLKFKEFKENDYYVIEFNQISPLFKLPLEANPILRDEHLTWVNIGTMKSWSDFIVPIAEKYEKILSGKSLPPSYQAIVLKAAKEKNNKDKIDVVVSELANIMTYSGDWTTLEKFYYPQELKVISTLNTGDCKDFSLATVAMLRNLGINATVALTERKAPSSLGVVQIRPSNTSFPRMGFFNHAIVKVKEGQNIWWVDPTNIVTDAGYTFSDIAGSFAIEVAKTTTGIEKIAQPFAHQSKVAYDKTIIMGLDDTVESTTSFEITGNYARSILQMAHQNGEDTGKKVLSAFLRTDSKSAKNFYTGIDLKTRGSKLLKGTQKSVGEKIAFEKEGKKFISIPLPLVLKSLNAGYNRVTDFNGSENLQEVTKTQVQGFDFVTLQNGCTVLSPWYNLERTFTKINEGFEVQDTLQFHSTEISAADINSDKFQMYLQDIDDCYSETIVEVRQLTPTEKLQDRLKEYTLLKGQDQFDSPGALSIEGARKALHIANQLLLASPADRDLLILKARALRRVGFKSSRVDRSEFLTAAEKILKSLTEQFPNDPKVLAQNVYGADLRNNKTAMLEEFKKYYALAAKDYDTFILGGVVSEELGNFSAAKSSYLKAFSLAKNVKEKAIATSNIAEVSEDMNDIEGAISYYKQSLQFRDDSWIQGGLLQLYNRAGRYDEAISTGEDLVKKSPYGVAKENLADAYANKAQYTLNLALRTSKDRNSESYIKSEREAEGYLAKGLTHHSNNRLCLSKLSALYVDKAQRSKDVLTVQKALTYIEKKNNSLKANTEEDPEFLTMKFLMAEVEKGSAARLPAKEGLTSGPGK